MSFFRKQEQGAKPRPVDDILEGVDIIGTMIDEALPRIEKRLEEMTSKLDQIIRQLGGVSEEDEEGSTAFDLLTQRTAMLEEQLLSNEQANVNRLAGLGDELEELSAAIQALHEKFDALLEKEELQE